MHVRRTVANLESTFFLMVAAIMARYVYLQMKAIIYMYRNNLCNLTPLYSVNKHKIGSLNLMLLTAKD